ncbi:hypothetical protein ABZT08_26260 [Streptomyces sp. NPDC005526]|uniref:hypothetical protein n=1 Tax=Streptomyces sp. NPDC005526 TaxID=3156885 RepID=UPI0033A79DC0
MTDTGTSLGPLELADGRWVVGDSRRPGGSWIEFRSQGLYPHTPAGAGEPIPWSRIMSRMRLTLGGRYPNKGVYTLRGLLALLPGLRGSGAGYLHLTVREPYEDRTVYFDRHVRGYPGARLMLLEELLSQLHGAGETHRLGDPHWLGRVVAELAAVTPWTFGRLHQEVARARRAGSGPAPEHRP